MGVKAQSMCPLRVSWEKWQSDPMKTDKPKKYQVLFHAFLCVLVCEDMQVQESLLFILPKALKPPVLTYREPGTIQITEPKM